MVCFSEKIELELPSVIRGLTFDGVKGLFIHTMQGKKPALTLSAVKQGDEVLHTTKRWMTEFTTYCSKLDLYPAVIGIEGRDIQFGLGTNYDEAVRGEGVSSIVSLPPSTKSDDVLRDKIALVTGGAQGFGEGIVRALSEMGSFVYIADIDRQEAEDIAASLNYVACITVAKALHVNVADEASVEAMMDKIATETGALDLIVHTTGPLGAGSVKTMTLQEFQLVTNTGFFLCTKYACPMLALQNIPSQAYCSDLIPISSNSALEGSHKSGAHAGAAFGLVGLMQSFSLELTRDNIKVNAICAGTFLDGQNWSDSEEGLLVQYLKEGEIIGSERMAEVKKYYETKVPKDKECRIEDVMQAIISLVAQKDAIGQAVPVTASHVLLH